MAKVSLKTISEKIKKLDLCMMTTITTNGMAASRPMSNNHDVKYEGTSYFFTDGKAQVVKDLKKNKHVNLSFSGKKPILPKGAQLFVSVSGKAKLYTERSDMEEHWNPDLEVWFSDGLDTKGLTMIEVKASHIKYWEGSDEGEVKINPKK